MECSKLLRTLEAYAAIFVALTHFRYTISTILFWILISPFANAQQSEFIQNMGQWNQSVKFQFAMPNGHLWLENSGWTLAVLNETEKQTALHVLHGEEGSTVVHGHVVHVQMVFSDALAEVNGIGEKEAYHNYILGNDRSKWKGHVPLFNEVFYQDIYRGIDLKVEQELANPKMTYIVHPNAVPEQIVLKYTGQQKLKTNGKKLVIQTSVGDIIEENLVAFQMKDGLKEFIPCSFRVKGDNVTFKVGKYDESETLFIDPTVIASTNSGCTSEAFGHTATFNHAGQIYSGGRCFGTGYPTNTGAFQVNFAGPYSGYYYDKVDMCLSKYNTDGSELIFATYLGGNGQDLPHSMIVNDQDQVVLLGSSNSTNYPTSTGAYDSTHNGNLDIVITSLTSDGSQLVGSTYVGGSAIDGVNVLTEYYADDYRGEVILDTSGNIYVASFSRSSNFPTTSGVFQDSITGQQDGVLFKLDPTLSNLYLSTYLGGSLHDATYALKLDDSLNVFVAGVTQSTNFPVDSNGAYPTFIGGNRDAFVVKVKADFTSLLAGSFFGTTSKDQNFLLEIDASGSVYLFGTSEGTITATTGKYVGPGSGAYVYKTTPELDSIEWISTFGDLTPAAFLVDLCNRIYISGQGAASVVLNLNNFDTLGAVNHLPQAGFYLMKLSPNAESMEFGTFYGNNGSHVDGGTSRFDKRGVVYQATCSNGTFPTTSWAYSTTNQTNNATYDNTVFKIDFESNVAKAEITPGDSVCSPFYAEFENQGSVGTVHYWWFGDGTFSTDSMPTHLYDSVGTYDIFYVISDSQGCYGDDTAFLTLQVLPSVIPVIEIGDTTCVDSVLLSVDTAQISLFQWNTGQTTPSIYVQNEGVYSITTTADLFCLNSDTVDITFLEAYHFNLRDTGICKLNFPLYGPAGAVSYLWNTGDTTRSTLADTTGIYTLTASNGECEKTESMDVKISYVKFDSDDTTTCFDSLELKVRQAGGNVLWSTHQTSPRIAVGKSGRYWVTVSNGFCISSDTIDVVFNPQLFSLGNDTVACEPFEISVNPDFDTYLWSNGATGSSIKIDHSMRIWLKVGDGFCTDQDTLDIIIENLNFPESSLTLCDVDSGLLKAPGPKNAIYYWSNGDTVRNTWAFESGNYWVNVRTPHCSNLDTLAVKFVTTPKFSIGNDTSMCVGETLSVPIDTVFSQVYWNTGDSGLSITLQTSGSYWAGQYFEGCWVYDTINVELRQLFSDSFSLINNVMTPNGDGFNEELKFYVVEPSLITNYHLEVFDRWGWKLFETTDINEGWKGTRKNGNEVKDGTYFYMMRAETVCVQRPTIEVKDNVTLLR